MSMLLTLKAGTMYPSWAVVKMTGVATGTCSKMRKPKSSSRWVLRNSKSGAGWVRSQATAHATGGSRSSTRMVGASRSSWLASRRADLVPHAAVGSGLQQLKPDFRQLGPILVRSGWGQRVVLEL